MCIDQSMLGNTIKPAMGCESIVGRWCDSCRLGSKGDSWTELERHSGLDHGKLLVNWSSLWRIFSREYVL